MARTYDRTTMDDISLFSTVTPLEELGFLDPVSVLTEEGFLDDYDVFNGNVDNNVKLPTLSLSAGELFEELQLEACDDFLDCSWMTEKVDLSAADPVLPLEDEPSMDFSDLTNLTPAAALQNESLDNVTTQISEEEQTDNMFSNVEEIINRLCAGKQMHPNAEQTSSPSSPPQNVPNIEVLSPQSEVCDESVASPLLDTISPTSPNSPDSQDSLSPREPRSPHFFSGSKGSPQSSALRLKTPQQRKRKREQNKDAATRYRVKKREESESVRKELTSLEKDNVALKEQVTSLSKEIEYLKNLMLEVYKTKLLKQSMIAC